jgi:UDP-glucose 4-epimerase
MNSKHQTVLVTGGAGFIGSELVRQLKAQGAQVIVFDNLVNGKRENLEGVIGDQVQLVVADLRDEEQITRWIKGVDIIFHLACLGVRHSIHAPLENHEVNATATLRLLMLARGSGVQRFVYVSSSEVYGTARTVPMSEEHPAFPMTVYGASKLAGECYARAFFETYNYSTVVVRPFNAYGPRCHHEGDSGEVIPKFMLRCLAGRPLMVFGDGTQARDFTYVSDTARGIALAGFSENATGQTINLGSGREISIRDLARDIQRAVGRESQVVHDAPRPGDVLRLCADIAKARNLIGFEPQVTLHEGLMRLKEWYASRSETAEALLETEIVRNWESAHGKA